MSKKRAHLFGSLARLTAAGIPVLRAGEIMKGHARDGLSREAMQALEQGLRRGESIAQSLRPALTNVEYRMVDAAESALIRHASESQVKTGSTSGLPNAAAN